MRKRLTALIMAVLMLLQLLPASVVAETTDEIISDVLTAPESHTVSFWVNGEKIKTVFVQDGSALGLLPDAPEYENLQFDGWYAGNELLTTDYIVSADLTVEAVYTEIAPQTIERTFEFDSLTLTGFVPESVIVDAEDVFEKYADYMKNESVVAAWNISAGQNDEYPLAAAFKVSSSVKDSIWKAWKVLTDGTCEELKADIQEGALRFDVTKSGIYLVTESIPENVLRTTDGATYDISVSYNSQAKKGLADDLKLMVTEITATDPDYEAYIEAAAEKVGARVKNIELARAFDIRIVSAKDPNTVIVPTDDVQVTIRLPGEALDAYEHVDVLHFERTRGRRFAVSDMEETVDGETIQFSTGGFSVFVVAGYSIEKIIEAGDGNTYKITVAYDKNAGIPEGAEVEVKEVAENDYAAYLTAATEALGTDVHSIAYGKLFNISIVKDGVEYQPNDSATVTVELLDAASVSDVQVVHFDNEDNATKLNASTEGKAVTFETDGFSIFSFLDFSIVSKSIEAALKIGAVLNYMAAGVSDKISGTLYENDHIILTGSMPASGIVEASRVETDVNGVPGLVAYDIKIYANSFMEMLGITWQPDGESIQVTVKSDALSVEHVDVYHMKDTSAQADPVSENLPVEDHSVTFDAGEFSIYVVIDHEGNTNVTTPRVEFHYISPDYTENSNGGVFSYTAPGYEFPNTNGEYQITQILTDGEALEQIINPPNKKDSNGNEVSFFYGWYTVDMSSDSTAWNSGATAAPYYTGSITYTWPEPKKVDDRTAISITPTTGLSVGDEITWTIGSTTGTAVLDSEGTAHVYLVPVYQDYYFVNFHMGDKFADEGLRNNLLSRRLVVFGQSDSTVVRIGDVECPSPDPAHQIFAGWETITSSNETDVYYETLDSDGNEYTKTMNGTTEIDSVGTGYYITVSKGSSALSSLDLYPVFAEARWLYYSLGEEDNGAVYVPAAYRLTNDEEKGTYFSNLATTIRNGYAFDGWWTEQDASYNGTGIQLTDSTGAFVDGVKGQVFYNVDGTVTMVASGNAAPSGTEVSKLYEITTDGRMYFYKGLDSLTVYAKWLMVDTAPIRVIIWKQKVTDSVYATDAEKTYDYEIFYSGEALTNALPDLTNFSGSYVSGADGEGNPINTPVSNLNLQNFVANTPAYLSDYTGFHFAKNDTVMVGNPKPDGTSVYNVYYDRNVHTLTFGTGNGKNSNGNSNQHSSYAYTLTTGTAAPQYAFIEGEAGGQVVELIKDGNTWYIPVYGYHYVENSSGGFVKVGNEYVPLTPVTETTTTYTADYRYTYTTSNSGTQYGIVGGEYVELTRITGLYTPFSGTPNNSTTYYGFYNNSFVQLYYNNGKWYRTRSWSLFGGISYSDPYSGVVYTRSNNNTSYYYSGAERYAGTRYTRTTDGSTDVTNNTTLNAAESYYIDGNGGKVHVTPHTTEITIGYSYDNNGTSVVYTNEQRYSYDYGVVGRTIYTGDRYNRSGPTNSAHTVFVIKALYGQSLAHYFPIPGYENGERWMPQGDSIWTEVLAYIDSMPDRDVAFLLDKSSNTTKHLHYYVQALPGVTPTRTYNGVGFVEYSTIHADYGFFTEAEDYIDIDGFSKSGSYPPEAYNSYGNRVNQIWNNSSAIDIYCYYLRDQSDFTFDVNYPVNAGLTYSSGQSSNLTISNIYYEASLAGYATYYGMDSGSVDYTNDLTGPDHYNFDGWYEDKSCTVRFNFDTTMPVGNKIVYAKWVPEEFLILIDPNGAEIDHINHNGGYLNATPLNREANEDRSADSGYRTDQSTYFFTHYGESIGQYAVSRSYVPIGDTAAAVYVDEGRKVYAYVNIQYLGGSVDGEWGVPYDLRNALYVDATYGTDQYKNDGSGEETELYTLYKFYHDWINSQYATNPGWWDCEGAKNLSFSAWKNLFVEGGGSPQLYRKCNSKETWVFLGWFRDGENMPYNFSDPVEEPFTLTAHWRLDGGYTIQYTPEYWLESSDGNTYLINGDMEAWLDPTTESGTLSYTDGAQTKIYKQPTNLTKNNVPVTDNSVNFLGWRLVSVTTTTVNGNTVVTYTPLEFDENGDPVYYDPNDEFTIDVQYSDSNNVIHMQAVYEEVASSIRRPEVANLTLDANSGYLVDASGNDLTADANLFWDGVGIVLMDENAEQIVFGDIQSSAAVHLYKYATNDADTGLTGGTNYFKHRDGYFLLGFDPQSNPDAIVWVDPQDDSITGAAQPYVPNYPADSVIAVQRTDDKTIYAIWEPMVYMTFENKTNENGLAVGPITLGLSPASAADAAALTVINVKDGMYTRTPLADYGNITIPVGESVMLAFPKGSGLNVTVSGTNDQLGNGSILYWESKLGDNAHGTAAEGSCDNGENFSFTEPLVVDETGIVVTFTSDQHDRTLVFDDNYAGGTTQEVYFTQEQLNNQTASATMPSTNTRFGYTLVGWATTAEKANAGTIDYETGYVLDGQDLVDYFGDDIIKALYAVWESQATANTVYVFKTVPTPGSQTQPFTYTLSLSGIFSYKNSTHRDNNLSETGTFTLTSGQHAKIYITEDIGTDRSKAYLRAEIAVYAAGVSVAEEGSATPISTTPIEVQAFYNGEGTFSGSEKFSVTEGSATHYTPSVEIAASTVTGSSQDITALSENTISWAKPSAGGTAIFTNTLETYDITVDKTTFVSGAEVNTQFAFTASYVLNGATTNLGTFYVNSGTPVIPDALKGIPAGATLTITEIDTPNEYTTTIRVDSGSESTAKTIAFEVSSEHTVYFVNTLKSYPVKFVKVDQSGTAGVVEAIFRLDASGYNIGNNLLASDVEGSDGVFYTGTLNVGSYTLQETFTEDGYIGLAGAVTIAVSGDETSPFSFSDPNMTAEKVGNVWEIRVKNQEEENITIVKAFSDPLINSSRTFIFNYSYQFEGETKTGTFNLAPASGSTASNVLTIPSGATSLVIEEYITDTSYDTTVALNSETATPGTSYTINTVIDAATITFTNTRKTNNVKVIKLVSDLSDTKAFIFTATLTYGSAIRNYAIYVDAESPANNLITDSNGQVTFTLSHNEWKNLAIPEGAKLVLTETLETGYLPSISAAFYTDSDNADESFTINSVTEDDEIIFTNMKNAHLTVSKTVSGEMGDDSPSNTFAFTLTLDSTFAGTEYSYTGVGIEPGTLTLDAEGKVTFSLAHGQSINIAELPLGTTITVTESHGIYKPTWTVTDSNFDTPTAVTDGYSFKLKGDADLAVVNNLPIVSPTGIVLRMTPYLWVMGAGILLLLLKCFKKKRSTEEGGWSS